MTTIQFYHLTETPLEKALPKVLEKAFAAKLNTLVMVRDEAQLALLNQSLWTYQQLAFLPHGTLADDSPERQPILLVTSEDNRNNAVLFCTTAGHVPMHEYARVVDMFDGLDEAAVASARARFKAYKDAGHEMHYFKQDNGAWVKAA